MGSRPGRTNVAGAILAGGRGMRLGARPKALLPLAPGGRPLVEQALAVLDAIASPVLISVAGAASSGLEHLGRTLVTDASQGQGPIAGLISILEASPHDLVVVVACDMPSLSPALLGHLVALAHANPEALAVVPRTAEGLHPLHAAYRRAMLPTLRAAAAAGRLALKDSLVTAGALEVPEAELRLHDPSLASLANVNTPDDLARALESLRSGP